MSSIVLVVGRTWDGRLVPRAERAELRLSWEEAHLRVDVDAPYAGDPAPTTPIGPTPGLWEHEVVELFVVLENGRYVELELSPHGHHLLLTLSGVRTVDQQGLPVEWSPHLDAATGRWTGTARVARTLFPSRPVRCNAFRIAGVGAGRRYQVMAPLPGERPDFHQPDHFPPWML